MASRRTVATLALIPAAVLAQQQQQPSSDEAQRVVITGAPQTAAVSGFSDQPLWRLPMQASVVSAQQMKDRGDVRLSEVARSDSSVSDAYNSEGYIDYLTIRGFVVNNRYNYRRDGLPINADTSIPLDNKERIEILKGTSGLQAGTSAPGGLVNLVVKRPTDQPLRSALVEWRERGSVLGAVDLSQRFGENQAFGVRLNVAAEHLDPLTHSLKGNRQLLALAADWRLSPDTLIEAEIESSHRSQPSLTGFSMLGNRLPDAHDVDPRLNLNNQPWVKPVVFDADTASLRLRQRLSQDWSFVAHGAVQRLRTDDRTAFPYGCSAEGNFDRFCSDGSFDYYDYRSEGERRRTDALDLSLQGRQTLAGMSHSLAGGVLFTHSRIEIPDGAFNLVPEPGNISGTAIVSPDPTITTAGSDTRERSAELYLRDAIQLTSQWSSWLGVRHTRKHFADRDQSFSTPWLALAYEFSPQQIVYASWGQGVESYATPNLPTYAAPGALLAAQKSRQVELGVKGRAGELEWSAAWFDIDRPAVTDTGTDFFVDGSERHRGLEAQLDGRAGPWAWHAAGTWLKAERRGASDAAMNGLRPTNVPERSLRLSGDYRLAASLPVLLQAGLTYEGDRMVLPDNSVRIPGWTRVDALARIEQHTSAGLVTWRVGVDNLFDRRAWKESPYQFGHVYLYPLQERALRISAQIDL